MQWLAGSGMIHVALRLMKRLSNFDLLLNISGMVTLVVGFINLVWD
jgi:hypothetical protein